MHVQNPCDLAVAVADHERGDPLLLELAERRGGEIVEVRVAGGAVVVCRGQIEV